MLPRKQRPDGDTPLRRELPKRPSLELRGHEHPPLRRGKRIDGRVKLGEAVRSLECRWSVVAVVDFLPVKGSRGCATPAIGVHDAVANRSIQVRREVHDGSQRIGPLEQTLHHVLHDVLCIPVRRVVDPRPDHPNEALPLPPHELGYAFLLAFRAHDNADAKPASLLHRSVPAVRSFKRRPAGVPIEGGESPATPASDSQTRNPRGFPSRPPRARGPRRAASPGPPWERTGRHDRP
jgi:hypothetical protein